jgi:hypothetical protein
MHGYRDTVNLHGLWSVTLDAASTSEGVSLTRMAALPGTLDENRIGELSVVNSLVHLSREFVYVGAACYEREFEIPEHWEGKRIVLILERSRETEVWVDGHWVGARNSLIHSQQYDITDWSSVGIHRITVKVDNGSGIMAWSSIKNSHMVSEHTQTNWNGILGRIELQATDLLWMDDIQVFTDIESRKATISVTLKTRIGDNLSGKLNVRLLGNSDGQAGNSLEYAAVKVQETSGEAFRLEVGVRMIVCSLNLEFGESADLWDEFHPVLHELYITLEAHSAKQHFQDEVTIPFGIRSFQAKANGFFINNKGLMLRGKHDAAVFPLTGYAPMDTKEWRRLFHIAKSYGINHYRFHSWCPPEAAFQAADELGIYLQPELPLWDHATAFQEEDQWQYYRNEALNLLRAYGNHPSFVMMAWGNELAGSLERMEELVEICRQADSRRLYAIGSNNFFSQASAPRNSDYWTTFWTEGKWNFKKASYGGNHLRGSTPHPTRGHLNNEYPSTMKDYRLAIEKLQLPAIGHEIGQYQIHPDFKELSKYNGVLKPRNLEAFKEQLDSKGMLHQAEKFQKASGKLAALCYREEIEAALRTPGFGGFQLLDLQDFPGQGTALVGILDAFMDPKGILEPEEWRQFCCETVPLLRMKKYTWTNDESFEADVEIAHYGPEMFKNVVLEWRISDESNGDSLASGQLKIRVIEQGTLTRLGKIKTKLNAVHTAKKLSIELRIIGTPYLNRYPLWVYPARIAIEIPQSVTISHHTDEDTLEHLLKGGNVLLLPAPQLLMDCVPGAFIPDFWCYAMFKKYDPSGTLGISCDPLHPAFKDFPTAVHADWQWWCLMKNSRAMHLESLPLQLEPIVQVIDNVMRQYKLGLVFEVKVGQGSLVVCSIDLLNQTDRPEARQFLRSLYTYMDSDLFDPRQSISEESFSFLLQRDNHRVDHVKANRNADQFG